MAGLAEHDVWLPVLKSHVPVAYEAYNYTMLTYNVGDLRKSIYESDLVFLNKDIMFCQEIRRVDRTLGNRNHCFYSTGSPNNKFEAAILLNREKIVEAHVPEELAGFENENREVGERQTTVCLNDIIVIAWHGRYRVEQQQRVQDFQNLLAYAVRLRDNYQLPVIIGGDFNLTTQTVTNLIGGTPNAVIKYSDIKEETGSNIDFFLIFTPGKATENPRKPVAKAPPDDYPGESSTSAAVIEKMERLDIGIDDQREEQKT